MKSLLTTLAVAAMLGTAANAAEINRIGNTPQANILTGVIVPPGAEIFHLSGQLASPIDPSKPATSVEAFGDTKTQTISIFNKIKEHSGGAGLCHVRYLQDDGVCHGRARHGRQDGFRRLQRWLS
jgi:hypothetical protein